MLRRIALLQRLILIAGIALTPMLAAAPTDVIIDNDDGPPAYTETGTWSTSSIVGYDGGTYRTVNSSSPPASATWRPTFTEAATREVYAVFRGGTNRTPSAPYTVTHSTGSDVVLIDQTGLGVMVSRRLGEFAFEAGSVGSVRLDNSGDEGYHISDAILFELAVNDPPAFTAIAISPDLPSEGERVTVTALITDEENDIATAHLHYSVTPTGASATLIAHDDGAHGDGDADDGIHGATIPAMPSGATVTYHFEATDTTGMTGRSASRSHTVDIIDDPTPLRFILAGQSNASGRGALDENTESPNSRVLLFGNDYQWRIASEPIDSHIDQVDIVSDDFAIFGVSPRHGFSLRAAKDLVEAGATSVHIVPGPLGASSIAQWRRGADPLDRTTLFGSMNFRRLTAAPEGLTALWWYQGESNAGSPNFVVDHSALVAEFREEMGQGLPIIYVQLGGRVGPSLQPGCEAQRRMETGSGDTAEIPAHHMVVAFDLDLYDTIHIDAEGQREIGRRVALATREHVLGHSVDGTGPRLAMPHPLVHPADDRSMIRIRTTQPLNVAVNEYDNQFRTFDDNLEVGIDSVVRDPLDPSSVLVTLLQETSGTVTISYGDLQHTGGTLDNAVRGASGLPLPRFGPLEVILESTAPISGSAIQSY